MDPRARLVELNVDRLVEPDAEARGPKEGKRKAGTLNGLLDRPMKGG